MPFRHVILGTAGHIDHGKTSLVKALTGVDTDRLPEEKSRGMTIDLGFAHLNEFATIIDVPGHEKFVKNMVAGVSTIDLVLFVIAADDGVMPQTREHLDICQLLQIQRGLIALTKIDLVEPDWLALIQEDIRRLVAGTFLAQAPLLPVSTVTGEGIVALKKKLSDVMAQLPPRPDRGVFWMPVDRTFTMKGFGTVVTGSVLSGQARPGDELEILPERRRARVRGLQRHGQNADQIQIGDRAAINVQGIATEEIMRGQVLTLPDYFGPTMRINCRLRMLASAPAALKLRTRVRVHLGTAEIMARVIPLDGNQIAPGETGYAQLRFEKLAATRRLEPLVLRQYSPPRTIGGGIVLDAEARPLRRRDPALIPRLAALEQEEPAELLIAQLLVPERYQVTLDQIASETGHNKEELRRQLENLLTNGTLIALNQRTYIHRQRLETLWHRLVAILAKHHEQNPLKLGLRKAEVSGLLPPLADSGLMNLLVKRYKAENKLKEVEAHLALSDHEIRLSETQQALRQALATTLYAEGYSPSSPAELALKLNASAEEINQMLNVMQIFGELQRLEEGIWMHQQRLVEARKRVIDYLRQHGEITVSQFKELVENTSRKFAMPLLHYFDTIGVTQRQGEARVLGVEAG